MLRETLRRLLDRTSEWTIVALVALTGCSAMIGDLDREKLVKLLSLTPGILATVVGVMLLVLAAFVGFFYLFSFVTLHIGRFLEGESTWKRVRTAMAWSLVPFVVALLYRIPAMFLRQSDPAFEVRVGNDLFIGGMSSGSILLNAADFAMFILWLFLGSVALAEAFRFSAPRGLATLALTSIAPFAVVIAAVLAAITS